MDHTNHARAGVTDIAGFDVVILGAGISGLVSASILVDQGHQRILVLDEYDHVGGNHINWNTEKYTFDIGCFIFQDDSPLLRHLPELLPHYVAVNPRVGRLNPSGLVTAYPLSLRDDILHAGPIEWVRLVLSLLASRIRIREIRNAKHFAEYWIGARLLKQSGLQDYMERFYGVPPEQIDVDFAEKRMYWIRDNASLLRRLRRLVRPSTRPPSSQQLVRPREGFDHLYAATVERLRRSGVSFIVGEPLLTIRQLAGGTFSVLTANNTITASRVVSTIPLDRTIKLCGIAGHDELPTVTMLSLFFSFAGTRGFRPSILYNFSHRGAWKRLTMFSDYYGRSDGREYFTVEINTNAVGASANAAERDFRRHTSENGLFAGDLQLEGSHVLSNAYPTYVAGAEARAKDLVAALRAFGVESFGRQGGFDYQPTARVSALQAEAALSSG